MHRPDPRALARDAWYAARATPVRAAAVVLGSTILAATIGAAVAQVLVLAPLGAIDGAFSTLVWSVLVSALVWGFCAVGAAVAGWLAAHAPLAMTASPQTRAAIAGGTRRWGILGGGLLAALVVALLAPSTLLTVLLAAPLVLGVLVLSGAGSGRRQAQRWLIGHLTGAGREYDPTSPAWELRNVEWDGTSIITAEAWYPPTLRVSDPAQREAIERAVMWALRHEPREYTLRWERGARMVRILAEPPLPTNIPDGHWPDGLPGIPVGVCAHARANVLITPVAAAPGQPDPEPFGLLTWDPNDERDLLIAGVKGSGKTILARRLIVHGLGKKWFPAGVMTLDGKSGADYAPLEGREGILVVARMPPQWKAALDHLVSIMEERYEAIYLYQAGHGPKPTFQRLGVVIDEIQNIVYELGEDALGPLSKLARMARAAGISLIVITQRPDAKDAIPGAVRDQLEDRIAVGWMSADGGRMVLGDAWRLVVDDDDPTGEEATLVKPRGRAVGRVAGRLVRLQVPFLASPVDDPKAEALYPPRETTARPITPPTQRAPQPAEQTTTPPPAAPAAEPPAPPAEPVDAGPERPRRRQRRTD